MVRDELKENFHEKLANVKQRYQDVYSQFQSAPEGEKAKYLPELRKLNQLLKDLRKVVREDQNDSAAQPGSIEDSMMNNVKDALMFLKMSGETKVPTEVVFNEFKNRGIEISLEELQELFPDGNRFIKSVNNEFVEFDNEHPSAGSGSPDPSTVSDLAKKAIDKRI